MAEVYIHPSIAQNVTVQGYARELSDYLNGTALSRRLGKNGGFERNNAATQSGILKIHIRIPGEALWGVADVQRYRTSNNYLVYARHWDFTDKFQIISIVTPDAHERIDGLLPDIIKIAENDFHSLNQTQLDQLTCY